MLTKFLTNIFFLAFFAVDVGSRVWIQKEIFDALQKSTFSLNLILITE